MKLVLFCLLLLISFTLFAKDIYFETAFQGDYSAEPTNYKSSIGFEYFKKFSNDYGDFLTADLQVRLAHNFENEKSTLEIHNAWLEYKYGLGKFIRFGHFAPAFGIEKVLDTHSTLWQTNAMQNVGFKQDWGIGYRSFIGDFDYSFSAQTGSGMSLRKDGFLLSGRSASSSSNAFQFAFSALYGDIHSVMSMATYPVERSTEIINKKRIALEVQYNFGAYYFKNEISAGYNDTKKIISNFAEFEFKSFTLINFNFIVQNKYFKIDKNETINWLSGASYKFWEIFTLSFLYDISDENLQIKLYYFN